MNCKAFWEREARLLEPQTNTVIATPHCLWHLPEEQNKYTMNSQLQISQHTQSAQLPFLLNSKSDIHHSVYERSLQNKGTATGNCFRTIFQAHCPMLELSLMGKVANGHPISPLQPLEAYFFPGGTKKDRKILCSTHGTGEDSLRDT